MAKLPLSRMQRFIALSADLIKLVARGEVSHPELDTWNHTLQLMKERRLGYALSRSTELADAKVRHRLYNELMTDLSFLSQRDQRLLRQIGVRYVAELYLVDCHHGPAADVRRAGRILDALWHHLQIPRDINPLMDGWRPIYWGDDGLRALLSLPVLTLIGDRTEEPDDELPLPPINRVGITSEARLFHVCGCHWGGHMLQSMQACGRDQLPDLTQLKRAQSHLRGTRLWARFVVPADWTAPKGIPACWTELFDTEIRRLQENEAARRLGADVAWLESKDWLRACEQRVIAYRTGIRDPSDRFDVFDIQIEDLGILPMNVGLTLKSAGVSNLGQLLQILPEELNLLLRAYGCTTPFPTVRLFTCLQEMDRVTYPVVLPESHAEAYPLPEAITRLRAHLDTLAYPNLTQDDSSLLRPYFLLLIQPPSVLEMMVRVILPINDSERYQRVWELCVATNADMINLFGPHRDRSIRMLDHHLRVVGLKRNCDFSDAAKALMRATSVDALLEIMYSSAPA